MSLVGFFTEIADALRSKKGTTDKINAVDFPAEIENLEIFDDYYKAYGRYMELSLYSDEFDAFTGSNLWIVYIDENNRIVQFEQLSWKIKCKIVELRDDNT